MPTLSERADSENIELFPIGADKRADRATIDAYDILESLPADSFDRIMEMAADVFDAPIAAVRIADSDRIWCKPPSILNVNGHGKLPSFSGFMRSSVDSRRLAGQKSDRSLTMPLVAAEFGLRFYVSAPLNTYEGYTIGTLCVVDREQRRIDDRQIRHLKSLAGIVMDQMDARLAALRAVAQADILTIETDHRVMNSLQFVSGLLDMQSRSVRTTEAAAQLALAASRVAAVARVHRHFSLNEGAQRVPVLAYLQRLCADLSNVLDAPIQVEGIEASVPSNQVLAIGFSVNELITNAKKYGAPPIKVTFAPDSAGQHRIEVMDEGAGLPEGFVIGPRNRGDGLGMKVITALVAHLSGNLSAGANPTGRGAYFSIAFPRHES